MSHPAQARSHPSGRVLDVVLLLVVAAALYAMLFGHAPVLGATAAEVFHEVTHDARHVLGVPCH